MRNRKYAPRPRFIQIWWDHGGPVMSVKSYGGHEFRPSTVETMHIEEILPKSPIVTIHSLESFIRTHRPVIVGRKAK